MKFFDYLFYRIAKFYYKRDGIDAPRAIGIVSIVQILLLGEIATIIFRSLFSLKTIASYSLPMSASKIGIGLGIIILGLNYFRYKGRYWRLADNWREKETSLQRKGRGWIVVLAIASPFILLVLLGTLFGRH